MAGNNAIGTGAVILTANADQMLAGLDRAGKLAARKAEDIGDRVAKAAKSGGKGGLFGDLLGGAAGGAIFAGAKAAFDGLFNAAGGAFERLGEAGSSSVLSIQDSFAKLREVGDRLFSKLFDAAAPVLGRLAEVAGDVFDRFAPAIEDGLKFMGDLAFVAVELFNTIAEMVTPLGRFQDAGIKVARAVATAFGYVWDSLRAGAGVIAYVAGLIVRGFGAIVEAVGEAWRFMQYLNDQLPDWLRVDFIGRAGDAMVGFSDKVAAVGREIQGWGKDQIAAFGQGAEGAVKWVDLVQGRLEQAQLKAASFTKKMVEAVGETKEFKLLSGVVDRGSAADYSIVQRFKLQTGPDAGPKQMVAEQQKTNTKLDRLIEVVYPKPDYGLVVITPY